jgi:hypothetical protein
MSTLRNYLSDLHQNMSESNTKVSAWAIIEEYFSFFGKELVTKELWLLLAGALSSDLVDDMDKALKRNDTIFFYEYTILFIDAVHLLTDYHKQKHQNPSTSK